MEQRIEYHSDHRMPILHVDTCTRSKMITYILDSSSYPWSNVCGTKKDRVTQ